MRRPTGGLPSFVTLPVALLAVVLWVRSYFVTDSLDFARSGTDVRLTSLPGRLIVVRNPQPVREDRGVRWEAPARREVFTPGSVFAMPSHRSDPAGGASATAVPYWLPVLIGLIPSAWWAADRRRRRRRSQGLFDGVCPRCGRPVSGTPPQVCRKCGMVVV